MQEDSPAPKRAPDNERGGLIYIHKTEEPLSKEQLAFNKLTTRITNLQLKIQLETARIDAIRTVYQESLFPAVVELGKQKISTAQVLDQKRTGIKLSQLKSRKLDELIIQFLDDAFSVIEPDDATKALYDKYATIGFDEEMSLQEAAMREDLTHLFYENFGVEISPEEFAGNPDLAGIEERLKAQFQNDGAAAKPGKKTKKQAEKQQLEAKKEELKTKSLRRIYLSLVKILHPDTEPDETVRIEKEAFMKKATVAYNEKNLLELLQLEMQWVSAHGQHLQQLDNDTLNVYMHLLKDQVKELETELAIIQTNARHSDIGGWVHIEKNQATRLIQRAALSYKQLTQQLSDMTGQLETASKTHSLLVKCIDLYHAPEAEDWDDFDDTFFTMK